MHTIALTRSISVGAPPEAVISLLSDARQLPRWAPGFARRVLPDGGQWIAEADDGTRTGITLRASPDHGTVDVLVTHAPPRGAYLRVLGNGGDSELVLTVIVPDPGRAGAVTRQQQVADDELRAVRDLAEGRLQAGRPVTADRQPRPDGAPGIQLNEGILAMDVLFIASVAVVAADPPQSRKLFIDALGLPLEGGADGYYSSGSIAGSKHFGVWPLSEAARACFGTSQWPAGRVVPQASIEFEVADADAVAAAGAELQRAGYELLHPARTEPWGQTVTRLLTGDGLIVGISYAPALHDEAPA